jgi:hypothetical protein
MQIISVDEDHVIMILKNQKESETLLVEMEIAFYWADDFSTRP